MRPAFGRLALVATLFAPGVSCAHRAPLDRPARADRNVITQQQLVDYHFANAFEAIEALRSNWLRARGPDSFRSPSQVWVYQDNIRLGGVDQLRAISLNTVAFIRHYDGITATGRWGLDHGQGVIYVSTHY